VIDARRQINDDEAIERRRRIAAAGTLAGPTAVARVETVAVCRQSSDRAARASVAPDVINGQPRRPTTTTFAAVAVLSARLRPRSPRQDSAARLAGSPSICLSDDGICTAAAHAVQLTAVVSIPVVDVDVPAYLSNPPRRFADLTATLRTPRDYAHSTVECRSRWSSGSVPRGVATFSALRGDQQ